MVTEYIIVFDESYNPGLSEVETYDSYKASLDNPYIVAKFFALNWEHAKRVFENFPVYHYLDVTARKALYDAAKEASLGNATTLPPKQE